MRAPTIHKYRIAKDYSHILWLIELHGEVTDFRYWIEQLAPDGIILRRDGSRYRNSADRLFEERLKGCIYADWTERYL